MDNPAFRPYLPCMFNRLVVIVALLAITLATTVHVVRMGETPDHATHIDKMIQAQNSGDPSCNGGRDCGATDHRLCDFVCASLTVFLPPPNIEAASEVRPASHDLLSETLPADQAPGPEEHPPELRLL